MSEGQETVYEAGTVIATVEDYPKSRVALKLMKDGRYIATRQRWNVTHDDWMDVKGLEIPKNFLNPELLAKAGGA